MMRTRSSSLEDQSVVSALCGVLSKLKLCKFVPPCWCEEFYFEDVVFSRCLPVTQRV